MKFYRRRLGFICLVMILISFLVSYFTGTKGEEYEFLEGKRCVIQGQVIQKEIKNGYLVLTCQINQMSISGQTIPKQEKCITYFNSKQLGKQEPKVGMQVLIDGKICLFSKSTNPGEFSYRNFQKRKGIYFSLKDCKLLKTGKDYSKLKEYFFQANARCSLLFQMAFNREDAGVMQAILLGNKSAMDEDVLETYQLSGIGHFMAISGLHISMIGLFIQKCLRKMRIPFSVSDVAAILVIVLYGVFTGMAISSIRAIVMFSMRVIAQRLERSFDAVTGVMVAAVLLGMRQPELFLTSGVQLSFGIVLGISYLSPVFEDFPDKGRKLYGPICVLLTSYPILLWHYYSYSLYSFLLNLILIPLLGVIVFFGFLTLIFIGIGSSLYVFCVKAVELLLWISDSLSSITLKLPGNQLIVGRPMLWQIVVYLLFLFVLGKTHEYWKKKWILIGIATAFLILNVGVHHHNEITFLDVGQGDGIVLTSKNGQCITIDGGSSSKKEVGEKIIVAYLKYKGVGTIDYAVITHLDEDHYNGILEILEKPQLGIRINNIVLPEAVFLQTCQNEKTETENRGKDDEEKMAYLRNLAGKRGCKISYLHAGDQLELGEMKLSCLAPKKGEIPADMNDASLVFLLEWNGIRGLFTGDLSGEKELELIDSMDGRIKQLDFLKVSHHGSKYSGFQEYVDYVKPSCGIVSVGEGNHYGHPHKETLERLEKAQCGVLRTDQKGAIWMNDCIFSKTRLFFYENNTKK